MLLFSVNLCLADSVSQPSTGPCSVAGNCGWQPIYDAGLHVTSYIENWVSDPVVTAQGPITDIIKESTKENCACGSTLVTVTRNESRTHKVHVNCTVGAGAEVEAAAKILAVGIKGKVYANVELNGGWEGEWTESWTTTISKTFQECWRQTYRLKKDKYTSSTAEIKHARCVIFAHYPDGTVYPNPWTCGYGTTTGTGQGWTNEVEGWYGLPDCTHPTPPCGG